MKHRIMTNTVLCCVALLGSAYTGMASDEAPYAQKIQQEEAIVVRIDQHNVTLQAAKDKDKIVTAPFSNAEDFKVGDRVVVIGNSLKPSDPAATPQPGDAPAKEVPPVSKD